VDNYFALLRELDAEKREERERREAEYEATRAYEAECPNAWRSVYLACELGDRTGTLPDMACFITLAKLLQNRGWFDWLSEMIANFEKVIDDPGSYRPGHIFIARLLQVAGQDNATPETVAPAYLSFLPSAAPPLWRTTCASDICDFLSRRIDKHETEKRAAAERIEAEVKATREAKIVAAAQRRPALAKQVFAVYWSDKGKGPAEIRDKWNDRNRRESVGDGAAGRDDIKSAIRRGKEFLAENGTTVSEVAEVMRFEFGN
jgi:hypothetical protein